MRIIDLSSEKEKLHTFFRLIIFSSLFIILATSSYGIFASITQDVNVVGETLVTFEVPPISMFPLFYSKPITWLSAAILAMFFSVLELNVERISKWSKSRRDFIKFASLFIGAMAFYEVLFNFTLWSGLIARDAILGELNVDIIKNPFPNPQTPWNIVFATKLFTVLTIIAAYSVMYLYRIESKQNEKN
jgi:hypothetical protein